MQPAAWAPRLLSRQGDSLSAMACCSSSARALLPLWLDLPATWSSPITHACPGTQPSWHMHQTRSCMDLHGYNAFLVQHGCCAPFVHSPCVGQEISLHCRMRPPQIFVSISRACHFPHCLFGIAFQNGSAHCQFCSFLDHALLGLCSFFSYYVVQQAFLQSYSTQPEFQNAVAMTSAAGRCCRNRHVDGFSTRPGASAQPFSAAGGSLHECCSRTHASLSAARSSTYLSDCLLWA